MTARLRRILPLILVLLLGGCATQQPSSTTFGSIGATVSDEPTPLPSATPEPPSFPLTLTDDAGREVEIPAAPRRIVSLAPSNTEIVCALDACDRLVGVPEFRDGYPEDVLEAIAEVPNVVSFGPVDREAIVAAEPQLVLAAGNELTPSDDIAALEQLGLPVMVLYPQSVAEVEDDLRLVAAALGRDAEGEVLVADMEARIAAVAEAVAGAATPRAFYEVSVFEGQIYTAGEDSFLASVLEIAGAEPITGDPASTAIDLESLVTADPELILLGDAAYDPTITPASVAQRQGWGAITAVADGQVVAFTDDLLVTRPGPRIVDGIEALARTIHPDRFPPG